MKRHPMLPALTVLGCLACTPAHAADTWTQPYPGVDHLARSTPAPNEIHVVVVDLNSPAVRVRATKPTDRGATVSDFASMYGCQIAINGDFFTSGFVPRGLAKGAGEFWSDTNDGAEESFVAFSVNKDVIISSPWDLVAALDAGHHDVVSGRELVTIDGAAAEYVAGNLDVHPRTAVGVDATGQRLFVAVVDGRSTASVGMTLFQLGVLMADVGAWQAINLDGGGSSAIAVAAEGGIVNHPSDGTERLVANHLGIAVLPYAALVESTSWRDGEVVSIEAGDVVEEYVEFRNMGTEAWTPGTTKLAPTPRGMPSVFGGMPQWLSEHRVSTVDRVVAPGEVARFALPVSGDVIGEYTQSFTLVQEGVTWFGDGPLAGGPDDDAVALTARITNGSGTTSETFGATTGNDSTGTSSSEDTGVPDDQSTTAGADRGAETPDSDTDAGANRGASAGCNVGRSNWTDGRSLTLMLVVLLLACIRRRRAGRTDEGNMRVQAAGFGLTLMATSGCDPTSEGRPRIELPTAPSGPEDDGQIPESSDVGGMDESGNDGTGDRSNPDDPEPPSVAELTFYLGRLAPALAARSLSYQESLLIEQEGEPAIATLLSRWTTEPGFAEAMRDMVSTDLSVSGERDGVDFELPGNLVSQIVREGLPWSTVLTADYCVDAEGVMTECDTGAPYEAGVLGTRAFLISNKGRFNLGRAKKMLEVFACRGYPMEADIQIPLEKDVLIPMFRAVTPEEQTVEEAEGGFGNGAGCYTCHAQFGAHAQLFVKFDDAGIWQSGANGLQDPEDELGRSAGGLYTSHFDDPDAAQSEFTWMFGQQVGNLRHATEVLADSPLFDECTAKNLLAHAFGLQSGTSREIDPQLATALGRQIRNISDEPTLQEIVVTVFTDQDVVRAAVAGVE